MIHLLFSEVSPARVVKKFVSSVTHHMRFLQLTHIRRRAVSSRTTARSSYQLPALPRQPRSPPPTIDVLAVQQRRQLFDRVQLLSGLFELTLCGQQLGGQSGRGSRQLLAVQRVQVRLQLVHWSDGGRGRGGGQNTAAMVYDVCPGKVSSDST